MNSIDRKILRCQREIEAALPKGLSFADFETGVHWPKGWTAASLDNGGFDQEKTFFENLAEAKPLESPPSVQKFKPGDRVRSNDAFHIKHNLWQAMTILTMPAGDFIQLAEDTRPGYVAGFHERHLELIPPASETETEGLIEGAIYRVKFPSGNVWLSRWQNGEWWGSSDLTRPDVLKNKKMGGQNDAGVYECLGLEWAP